MSWNYRICKEDGYYTIRECYYNDKDKMDGWTADPCYPRGTSLKELKDDLTYMRMAFYRPVVRLPKGDK